MNWEIYDIKIKLFTFLYSFDYLFLVIFLLIIILFYYMLYFVFNYKEDIVKKQETLSDDSLSIEIVEKKIEYLVLNIDLLDRNNFYTKLLNIIRDKLYLKYRDKKIYNMTFSDVKKNIPESY